jgi:hypothetical protein
VPLLFSGTQLEPEDLLALGDNLVVKRNDDSGSVYVIDQNNRKAAEKICEKIQRPVDYTKLTNEWWYREIETKFLVEKNIISGSGEFRPVDFKFFVFEGAESRYFFVEAIRRRKDGRIECGFFDSDLEPLKCEGKDVTFRGCLPFEGDFPERNSFPEMRDLALKLSKGFNFIRVDLYCVRGKVYFGEMTVCPSEGRSCFSPREFDFFLGKKWEKPVLLQGSGKTANLEGLISSN